MANVEDTYTDPSALRALYIADHRSIAMGRWRAQMGGSVPLTRFGHAELINAISLGRFRGDYGEADLLGALNDVRHDLEDGRLHLVDLSWRAAFDGAVKLSRLHSPMVGTRSLDVLHVASALELNARYFVTYDQRQAKLAALCGLKVIKP